MKAAELYQVSEFQLEADLDQQVTNTQIPPKVEVKDKKMHHCPLTHHIKELMSKALNPELSLVDNTVVDTGWPPINATLLIFVYR